MAYIPHRSKLPYTKARNVPLPQTSQIQRTNYFRSKINFDISITLYKMFFVKYVIKAQKMIS